MIKTDEKKKTQHLQKYVWNQKGKCRKNYILSSFVLLCCSASVIFNLHTDKRQKKYIST